MSKYCLDIQLPILKTFILSQSYNQKYIENIKSNIISQ